MFYGSNALDRSPCGTGTSARMAQLHARGALAVGQKFVHESIIGSLFTGRIEAETEIVGRPAIVPSVEGWAHMTGYNTIIIDDRDPYAHGFQGHVSSGRPGCRDTVATAYCRAYSRIRETLA